MDSRRLRVIVATGLIFLFLTSGVWAQEPSQAAASVVWEQEDPMDDGYGPGNYEYPTHEVFKPGLFDLLAVRVWDGGDVWLIDTQFALVTNPWLAPEGFQHQAVDIYIDTKRDDGISSIPHPQGPKVKLPAGWGWEYRIRLRPWNHSRIYNSREEEVAISAIGLPDQRTIRTTVSKELMPDFTGSSGLIVLVGGYDPYGIDYYRKVGTIASDWRFGGAHESGFSPNVLDLLAPEKGKPAQQEQLVSFTEAEGGFAVVQPVYLQNSALRFLPSLALGVLIVLLVLLSLILTRRLQWQKG